MFVKRSSVNILIFSILLLFSGGFSLSAQNKARAVTERLEWSSDENVLEYTVEVRNKANGQVKTFTTQNNYIEISEAPGDFEFRVRAVDVLGRQGNPSGWQSFKISRALTPAINSVPAGSWEIPESASDFAIIPVDIKNIQSRTKAQLVNTKTGEVIDAELITSSSAGALSVSGIKIPVLNDGSWKIKVIDPSGKTSESGVIKVSIPWPEIRKKRAEEEQKRLAEEKAEKERLEEEARRQEEARLAEERKEELRKEEERREIEKAIAEHEDEESEQQTEEIKPKRKYKPDFDIAAGYTIPVILFDDVIPKYMDGKVWPLSGYAKLDFIPVKSPAGNFGIGLSGSYTRMACEFTTYKIEGNLVTGHFNLVYQLPLYLFKDNPEKRRELFEFELHGGAGLTGLLGYKCTYENNVESKTLDSINLSFDGGMSIKFFVLKILYIEAGADFCYSKLKDAELGMLMPYLCAGLKF